MVRRVFVLLLLAAASLTSLGARPHLAGGEVPPDAQRWPGTFLRYEAGDPRAARDLWLYVPSRVDRRGGGPALVVYLHGCNQHGLDAAIGTRWNDLAERDGFLVAYPEQHDPNTDPPDQQLGHHVDGVGNGARCWNWFRPEHQRRGGGEPAMIAALTERVARHHHVDRDRVFVVGASAGANMAGILAATYPDVYAALGMLAGCAYASCSDVGGTAAAAAMGPHARAVPALVMQGTADTLVAFPLGASAVAQWLGTADATDDGELNGSVPRTPARTEHHGFDPSLLDGAGEVDDPRDLCVEASNWPCPIGVLGPDADHPVTIQSYVDGRGCSLLDFWIVHGLGHSYPGGDPEGSFTDPHGPDATAVLWDFLSRHDRDRVRRC